MAGHTRNEHGRAIGAHSNRARPVGGYLSAVGVDPVKQPGAHVVCDCRVIDAARLGLTRTRDEDTTAIRRNRQIGKRVEEVGRSVVSGGPLLMSRSSSV